MSGYELALRHYDQKRRARLDAHSARLAAAKEDGIATIGAGWHIATPR